MFLLQAGIKINNTHIIVVTIWILFFVGTAALAIDIFQYDQYNGNGTKAEKLLESTLYRCFLSGYEISVELYFIDTITELKKVIKY